jgi:hypothetical protein
MSLIQTKIQTISPTPILYGTYVSIKVRKQPYIPMHWKVFPSERIFQNIMLKVQTNI